MKQQNLVFIVLAIFFACTIFPVGVQALTYRSDVNNGSWSQYNGGLASTYYSVDSDQATYNRDFETPFSLNSWMCNGNWCARRDTGTQTVSMSNSNDYAKSGSYSGKIAVTNANGFTTLSFFQKLGYISDANVSFYYINLSDAESIITAGFVNDANTDWSNELTLPLANDWTYKSYASPFASSFYYRLFSINVYNQSGNVKHATVYIDDLKITRNNTGTFFKDLTAPYCSSISDCSNIDSNAGLTSNAMRHLYWVVDYVPSATCSWTLNGVAQTNLVEMTGGMYYGLIDDPVIPSSYKDFNLNASCTKPATTSKSFYASPRVYADGSALTTTLTTSNNLNSNVGVIGVPYSFSSNYKYGSTSITGADCNLSVDGTPQSMVWNGTNYATSVTFITQGSHTIYHSCSKTAYADANSTYSVTIGADISAGITITPISNVSGSVILNAPATAVININNNQDDVVFSTVTNVTGLTLIYNIANNSNAKEKQYFVYASDDGVTWTFNDSLTFGDSASYNNPVQKIGDYDHYDYSFSDSLTRYVPKYYKLVFLEVPAYWSTIKDSTDWINVNPASYYQDENTHTWDLFNDSNYTHLQSYTLKNYPQLTSTDFNTGFETQFTAYASTSTTILIGYRQNNGTDATLSVPLTTTPTRFSVPVALIDWNSVVIIKSTSSTSARIYLTDYAIIPRSYFTARLEITNVTGSPLNNLLRGGVNYEYIKEGVPLNFKTTAFDKDNDLKTLRIEAMIGATVVKTYDYDLTANRPENRIYTWDQSIEAILDTNGQANINGTLQPLRDFTIRATLINNSNQSVAEQFKTIKLLQYPYFPDDIAFNIYNLNKKVSDNPKFNINITQRYPQALLGIKFSIYDSSHTATNPNYTETVTSTDLGCTNIICNKTVTLTAWSFPDDTTYTIQGALILTTETQNNNNPLTITRTNVLTTFYTFETARLLQIFERRNLLYNSNETIPLILQIRNDSMQNIKNDFTVYIIADINNNGSYSSISTPFYPTKFVYDDITGYNYWIWNTLFYDDTGNLVPDGNALRFKAYVVPIKSTTSATNAYGLTNKCLSYPSDLNESDPATFLMNWTGYGSDIILGCSSLPSQVVLWDAVDANQLKINNAYTPQALQNESVFCVRTDLNNEYKTNLGDDFICGVLYKKSEEQIDGFKVYLGNANSDYSKTGDEAQYITFDVSAEEVMFNDIVLMQQALQQDAGTQGIHTWGQLLSAGFNKILPYAQPFADLGSAFAGNGILIQNVGWDVNLSELINPNTFTGIFFFKISGMKVINQFDYTNDYPTLETMSATQFRTFAQANKIYLPKKQAIITVYSRDFANLSAFKIDSPLVINETPSTNQTTTSDNNAQRTTAVPKSLKFNFIVDMASANKTKTMRATVPIVFSYIVPNPPFNFNDLTRGVETFLNDPVGATGNWLFSNWFYLVMLVMFLLIVSVIYLNFSSGKGGGTTIINNRGG